MVEKINNFARCGLFLCAVNTDLLFLLCGLSCFLAPAQNSVSQNHRVPAFNVIAISMKIFGLSRLYVTLK